MDLICSVQENVIFPLLLRHGLLSPSPKRKIMEVGVEAVEKEEEGLPWTLFFEDGGSYSNLGSALLHSTVCRQGADANSIPTGFNWSCVQVVSWLKVLVV
mgnify:CR=1 FL=1